MNGIFNLIKPPGPSSNDLVSDVKRLLKAHGMPVKKVGHTGTLDPGAAGVLPVCVGKATRLFDYLLDGEKEYVFELCFGVETDTFDSYGRVTARDGKRVERAEIEAILPGFVGENRQKPPIYSALKFGGKKLYEIARDPKQLVDETDIREKKARVVTIHALDLLEQTGENRYLLRMRCSKGTYVRTVCEDVANALGTVATVSFLLRSRSGDFALADAMTLADLDQELAAGAIERVLTPMDRALGGYVRVDLADGCFERLRNGNAVTCPEGLQEAVIARVYSRDRFFGLGEREGDGLRLRCVLRDEEFERD